MNHIEIFENGLYLVFEVNSENEIKLLHFSAVQFNEDDLDPVCKEKGWALFDRTQSFRPVEVNVSGLDRPLERHGNKYIITAPGYRMKLKDFKDTGNRLGRKLEITCFDEETGIETVSHYQFYNGVSVVRCWTVVTNLGTEPQTLEYVSSFNLNGVEKEGRLPQDQKMLVRVCHNSWQREVRWTSYTLPELGIEQSQPTEFQHSSKVFGVTNVGNWSAKEYIPMGVLENTEAGTALFWQIEHNGSWHWEISDQEGHLYLQLSGPSEIESHWSHVLAPNESFTSVPCAIGSVTGRNGLPAFDTAMGELTRYRRLIRRRNSDNERLPVIFNDYMNCLWGDPTAEKEYPLIDAAAEVGCEYFCIDAGWYADDKWWDEVGEWKTSKRRFPDDIAPVAEYARSKGLIPGLWLEIEVMGIRSPLLDTAADDSWFFKRHGKRVYDRSRYQLDFRVPAVRAHADEVIDRLVRDYKIGYIKMDYNIEPGIGTETDADSPGDGLLGHERAYLDWLDGVFKRHPKLVIENCSSGGLRMDYAMLSRYSIQSTSDQDDYRKYCSIAANAPTAVTPEQAAVWSYPLSSGGREEDVFNMVNSMLLRIHQSGHLAQIEPERRELVKEALGVYRKIRSDIRESVPFWPLGLSDFSDEWTALGLLSADGKRTYLAVWRREGSQSRCSLPIGFLKGKVADAKIIYPSFAKNELSLTDGVLTISLEEFTARLIEIK